MKKFTLMMLLVLSSVSFAQDSEVEEKDSKFITLESELSIVGTGGNSQFDTYNLKSKGSLYLLENIISVSGHYTYGTAGNVLSARNWDIKLRYDRELPAKMTGYVSQQAEGDKFAGFFERFNTELGASKKLIEKDKLVLRSEFAYRFLKENQLGGTEIEESLIRLYLALQNEFRAGVTAEFWVEYLPNLSDSDNYMASFGPSLTTQLSDLLSFKFGYEGRYDNKPAIDGNRKFDYTYTTSLIAKF